MRAQDLRFVQIMPASASSKLLIWRRIPKEKREAGGQFEVKQTEVATGYWELTLLNVDMKGKALFFKTISVQQKVRRSDFHQISDDLTVAEAANLLRKQAVVGGTVGDQ